MSARGSSATAGADGYRPVGAAAAAPGPWTPHPPAAGLSTTGGSRAGRSLSAGLTPRRLRGSVTALAAGARDRCPLEGADGKSGAALERVTIAGRSHVLKHVGGTGDWVARASGDRDCRPVRLWAVGLLDALPDCLDHAVVAAARGPGPGQGALLQHDVGRWLVAAGDTPLPWTVHRRFLEHMAALHVAFWSVHDDLDLVAPDQRYRLLAPGTVAAEAARGPLPAPLPLVPQGWARLAARAPAAAAVVRSVHAVPARITAPLDRTPATLLHGDWKAANLGVHPDGRTILLDWSLPGVGPPCADLAWYLAVNAARLPESKQAAVRAYRASLEARGVDTSDWWEPQLGLSLLGAFAQLGWEKALGDPDELAWWVDRVEAAVGWLA